jgi:hypothetical protein
VEPYRLTISSTEQLAHYATGQMTLPYTFDRNLAAVMPALWYCLHLPRSRFDFVPLGARPLKESQRPYLPHRLALVPVSLDPDLMSALNVDSPQVILLQDDLLEEAGDLISRLTGVARVILTSEMTQQQLQLHWDALHKIWEPSKATPIRVSRLITDPHLKACLLPAQFIARNLQGGSDAHVPAEFSSQDETLRYALHCQAVMSLTARLENARTTPEDAERMFPAKLVEEKTRFTCPITVAMWGLPAQSFTRQMKKSLTRAGIRFRASDAEVENCALRFVVAHRALSQGGIGFIADSIPDEAFNLLACLLNTHTLQAISSADEHVTVRVAPVGSTYLKTHMKVLVAECISADQLVGKLSRAGWSIAARSLCEAPNVQLEFGEFEQPQALRDALAQGQYDAVFISAHRHFDRQSGRTGIICGGTFVVEEELGDLPPIVCLSACQVSPREPEALISVTYSLDAEPGLSSVPRFRSMFAIMLFSWHAFSRTSQRLCKARQTSGR